MFRKNVVNKESEISFFNIPIIQWGRKETNNYKENYLSLFPKSFEKKALDKIIKFLPKDKKHDHVWVIRTTGLGEGHLLNHAFCLLNKKYRIKNACVVSQRSCYKDMFSLYSDIPFYELKMLHNEYAPYILHSSVKYKNMYFHIIHCTIQESLRWLKEHQEGDKSHLLEAIKKWWGIDDFTPQIPHFSDELKERTLEKIKSINLDLNNFIFIANESNGTDELQNIFWEELTDKIKEKGIDIFVNTVKPTSTYGKCANLSISEAIYLASLSKQIIALRCGFSELLAFLPEHKSIHILYSTFRNIGTEAFREIYTLKKYPVSHPESIYEYNVCSENYNEIITRLLGACSNEIN